MEIRKTDFSDIEDIMKIYARARAFMEKTGNPSQWAGGYPSRELLTDDIEKGLSYVCTDENGAICAVFMFTGAEQPEYRALAGKPWLNREPYGTVHRLASSGEVKGIAAFCFDYCKSLCRNLRADTHPDNKVMQRVFEKNGFVKCGVIRLSDGTPRIAYHFANKD